MNTSQLFEPGKSLLIVLVTSSLSTSAATLTVQITDTNGKSLPDAVVYALPKNGKLPAPTQQAVIDQISRQFVPLVSVVQTGTSVKFPNKDNIRHHVYSFSPAKTFELRLYSGVPASPVVFDKPGLAVLGCNIHDQMLAYVQVVDTPWFGKSDETGTVRIESLPPGAYEVRAWHYRLTNLDAEFSRTLTVENTSRLTAALELKP